MTWRLQVTHTTRYRYSAPVSQSYNEARLEPRSDLPIPAGGSIIAMNSVADDAQLFYTVKLSDGKVQSFVYDVKRSTNQPFPEPAANPSPGK